MMIDLANWLYYILLVLDRNKQNCSICKPRLFFKEVFNKAKSEMRLSFCFKLTFLCNFVLLEDQGLPEEVFFE